MRQPPFGLAPHDPLSATIPDINFADRVATALVVVDVQYNDAATNRG